MSFVVFVRYVMLSCTRCYAHNNLSVSIGRIGQRKPNTTTHGEQGEKNLLIGIFKRVLKNTSHAGFYLRGLPMPDARVVVATFSLPSHAKEEAFVPHAIHEPWHKQPCILRKILESQTIEEMLSYDNSVFSLDASVRIESWDREGLQRLIRYCSRPCFASENLRWNGPWLTYRLPIDTPHYEEPVYAYAE